MRPIVPDHWHFVCDRSLKDGKRFSINYVVRDGYEDKERELAEEMGYDVQTSGCNDGFHLGPEPINRNLGERRR